MVTSAGTAGQFLAKTSPIPSRGSSAASAARTSSTPDVQAPGCGPCEGGALDDPGISGEPQIVIFTTDEQSFHRIPAGLLAFERVPG
jgi:hypothetical protein